MMENRDIICISVSDWLKPWGSKQHLMVKMAGRNRVLYVEYQTTLIDSIKHPLYFLRRAGNLNRLRAVNKNIYVYTPIPALPFGSHSIFINRINQAILCFMLSRIIKRIGFKKPILWVYSPFSADLIGRLGESAVVYHCAADFINEKGNRLRQNTIQKLQTRLVKGARLVLTLTKGLHGRLKQINPNTFYFPSAVDLEYFENIRCGNGAEPPDLSGIKKPRLGVVGYFDGNIVDVDLLDYLAKANPEWSIVMVGPLFRNKRAFKGLKRNENVYFLGEKSPKAIPFYLKALDVCLIPYVRNKFTNGISSIKLYEYLAMGKPVVSTFFSEELADCENVIGIAGSKERFFDLSRESLAHSDDEEKKAARINSVSGSSWQKRLEFIDEKIQLGEA